MAYKNIEQNFSFADFAIQSFADKNHSLLFLRLDWRQNESIRT